MARVLVVYYSRSGTAARVARTIAKEFDADVEEIVDPTKRSGFMGWLRCAWESFLRKPAPIELAQHEPAKYALVVVGGPNWFGRIASPVRAYLQRHAAQLGDVAFFCTYGDAGEKKALAEMTSLSREPRAVLAVKESDIAHGTMDQKVSRFARALAHLLERLAPSTPPARPSGFRMSTDPPSKRRLANG